MTNKTNNSEPKHVDTYGCTLIGKDRAVNSDQFLVAELKRAAQVHHASNSNLDDSRRFGANQAHVILVADGVSGQAGARVASNLVVDEVMDSILNAIPWTSDLDVDSETDLRLELKETVERCNEQVTVAAGKMPEKSEMASTLTMAFVRWPTAFIVHAGDSRAYLIGDGAIEQLTTDHTFAQQMVEAGELDPEKAETSRFAKMLWNAVGGDSRVTPELTVRTLKSGDALLLCSDGLTSYLNADSVRHVVESKPSARAACEDLVGMIKSIGGHDDVTVAMARFEEEVQEMATEVEVPAQDTMSVALDVPKSVTEASVPAAAADIKPPRQARSSG